MDGLTGIMMETGMMQENKYLLTSLSRQVHSLILTHYMLMSLVMHLQVDMYSVDSDLLHIRDEILSEQLLMGQLKIIRS